MPDGRAHQKTDAGQREARELARTCRWTIRRTSRLITGMLFMFIFISLPV
jgi:hypothetical protein